MISSAIEMRLTLKSGVGAVIYRSVFKDKRVFIGICVKGDGCIDEIRDAVGFSASVAANMCAGFVHHEAAVDTIVAVPVTILSVLNRANAGDSVLFMCRTWEIKNELLQMIGIPGHVDCDARRCC